MTEEIARRKRAPHAKQDVAASKNPDALLTAETVSTLVGCRPDTVRQWVREGRFPKPLHIGRAVRWRAEVVNDWMRERTQVA